LRAWGGEAYQGGMMRIFSIIAGAALVFAPLSVRADSLAGSGAGRARLFGGEIGQFYGVAQQSITGVTVVPRRIASEIVVVSAPVALEISDRIEISHSRVKFRTNFSLENCNCSFTTLTGRAHVEEDRIVYSARSRDGSLEIHGVIYRRGGAILRNETRNDGGVTYTIRTIVRP
jgi:hypothetical protein